MPGGYGVQGVLELLPPPLEPLLHSPLLPDADETSATFFFRLINFPKPEMERRRKKEKEKRTEKKINFNLIKLS